MIQNRMFGLILKMFIGLLTGIVSATNYKKCLLLSSQKFTTQPTIINVYPNEYTQGLHYYLFAINIDRCVRSCNILNDFSNKVCSQQNRRFKSRYVEHDYKNK